MVTILNVGRRRQVGASRDRTVDRRTRSSGTSRRAGQNKPSTRPPEPSVRTMKESARGEAAQRRWRRRLDGRRTGRRHAGRVRRVRRPPAQATAIGSGPRARKGLGDSVELDHAECTSCCADDDRDDLYVAGDPSRCVALTCRGGRSCRPARGRGQTLVRRDIDAQMKLHGQLDRSRRTSLAAHAALTFGCTGCRDVVVEWSLAVNPLAAALSFSGVVRLRAGLHRLVDSGGTAAADRPA